MSKMCLSRQPLFKGIRNGDYEAKLFDTPEDLVTAVLTGEVSRDLDPIGLRNVIISRDLSNKN